MSSINKININGVEYDIEIQKASNDIEFPSAKGIKDSFTGSKIGFNDEGVPTFVNQNGREIAIATDDLDGNYSTYEFPERSGEIALKDDLKLYRYDVTLTFDIQDPFMIYTSFYSLKPSLTESEIIKILEMESGRTQCSMAYYHPIEAYEFNGSFVFGTITGTSDIRFISIFGNGYSSSAGDYIPVLLELYYNKDDEKVTIVMGYPNEHQIVETYQTQSGVIIDEVFVKEV